MTDDLKEKGREGLEQRVREHAFFADLEPQYGQLLAGCARNVRFEPGEFVLCEGEPANEFYLIREGRVALEIHVPGRPVLTFQTLGPGDIVGVSWLVPPHRWTYDARALERVRAISLDAECLRGKCDRDRGFGYEMMTRFVPMLVQRLQATRLQLLDVYGQDD